MWVWASKGEHCLAVEGPQLSPFFFFSYCHLPPRGDLAQISTFCLLTVSFRFRCFPFFFLFFVRGVTTPSSLPPGLLPHECRSHLIRHRQKKKVLTCYVFYFACCSSEAWHCVGRWHASPGTDFKRVASFREEWLAPRLCTTHGDVQ